MGKEYLVSIVVPMYNSEQFIVRCVDSILKQTYENIELIIVNDGSVDNGGAICEEYALRDNRVKYFQQANAGISSARNKGIENASGDYILFVDSDDWLADNAVDTFLNIAVDEKADIVILESKVAMVNGLEYTPRENLQALSSEQLRDDLLVDKWGNHAIVKLFEKDLWKKVRFPYGMIYEDLFTMPHLASSAKKIVYRCKPVYFYNRCNENSLTWGKNDFKPFHRYSKFMAYCEHEKVGRELNKKIVVEWSIKKALHESIKAFVIDAGWGGLNDKQRDDMLKYIFGHKEQVKQLALKDRVLLSSIMSDGFLYKAYGKIEALVK
ncbi:MAG: glycosyltransferase family 2 protein [Phascolarctobacterium sp.]|uniref:glycosyltransferase family 2 protein n=1 Tax=Phascolarctobacterium sp. TaxID=2049039 RepID=UPI0026DCB761|nr:glycosyltransferase family 2 protein [Phascolarctobacterium sp.]MDO4920610.1 glycosyltransferase family 2 protein [Phascolarctobacterium sp.]